MSVFLIIYRWLQLPSLQFTGQLHTLDQRQKETLIVYSTICLKFQETLDIFKLTWDLMHARFIWKWHCGNTWSLVFISILAKAGFILITQASFSFLFFFSLLSCMCIFVSEVMVKCYLQNSIAPRVEKNSNFKSVSRSWHMILLVVWAKASSLNGNAAAQQWALKKCLACLVSMNPA